MVYSRNNFNECVTLLPWFHNFDKWDASLHCRFAFIMIEGLQEKRKRKSLSLRRSANENIEPNTRRFKEAFVCAKDTKYEDVAK